MRTSFRAFVALFRPISAPDSRRAGASLGCAAGVPFGDPGAARALHPSTREPLAMKNLPTGTGLERLADAIFTRAVSDFLMADTRGSSRTMDSAFAVVRQLNAIECEMFTGRIRAGV